MFKDMKIKWRLTLGICVILIFLILFFVLSISSMNKMHTNLERVVKINNERTHLEYSLINDSREVSLNLRNMILQKEKADDFGNNILKLRENYDSNLLKLEQLLDKEDLISIELLAKIKVSRDESRDLNDQVQNLINNDKNLEATNLMLTKASSRVNQWIADTDELIHHEEELSKINNEEGQNSYTRTLTYMILISIIVCSLSLLVVILLHLSIIKPLRIGIEAAKRISSLDLTVDLKEERRGDEIGDLIESFEFMVSSLRLQVKEMKEGVITLASSSSEILASTSQIATGAAETASSISETSATVEEVRQAAQLSSEKANNVADNAQHAMQVTVTGQEAIDETINVMNNIRRQMESIANTIVTLSDQSQLIGGIIASVNDIADQSNLLAVNAAIEAAKAGEQGKGFTVVAQEIKSLAEQSKKATAQVRSILGDIQKATSAAVMATEQGNKAVEVGVKQSIKAGEAIRLISENSDESLQATTQIVASSQQQVIGMNQISLAMENINQAGIEIAASMKQSENTAKGLNELGVKLKQIVEQYKL